LVEKGGLNGHLVHNSFAGDSLRGDTSAFSVTFVTFLGVCGMSGVTRVVPVSLQLGLPCSFSEIEFASYKHNRFQKIILCPKGESPMQLQ
jgi:hypothetical protein